MSLTIHIRNRQGQPVFDTWCDPPTPCTVTVTPMYAERSPIPAGVGCRPDRPRVPHSAALERTVDHVVAWTGWRQGTAERPYVLPCTRNNVRAILRGAPDVLRQVNDGINAATASGVIR